VRKLVEGEAAQCQSNAQLYSLPDNAKRFDFGPREHNGLNTGKGVSLHVCKTLQHTKTVHLISKTGMPKDTIQIDLIMKCMKADANNARDI